MHTEKEVHKRFVRNNIRIERNLYSLCMTRPTSAHLTIRWVRRRSAGVPDDDLFQLISKMFAVELFGTYRSC